MLLLMGVMRILDATGHTELAWETTDPGSVLQAHREFVRRRSLGYAAMQREGKQYSHVTHFDEQAAEIYWLRPLRGG